MISAPGDAQGAVAIGWATVELERAATELAHLLAPGTTFLDAPSSLILGARCQIGSAAEHPALRLVLLEPDTEGRLAATLARTGEGWVATWAAAPMSGVERRRLSRARPGPLGWERLVLGGPGAGPHRLVVEAVPSRL